MMSRTRDIAIDSGAYGDLPTNLRQSEIGPPFMQNILRNGILWALASASGVAAFSIISFVGAPFVLTVLINAWFAGSTIYLSGLSYGIINDLIGVKKNLPYFSLGHQRRQKALIKSNDRAAVGIAWGIFASMDFSLIAGALFATATLITGFIGLPFAGFVLPVLAAALPIALIAAHLYSCHKEKQRQQNEARTGELQRFKNAIDGDHTGLNSYQNNRLKYWLKDTKDVNTWLGNSDRNMFGFISMPLVGIAGLVTKITCSAASFLLPTTLFGAAFSVFPPVGLGILLAVGMTAACIYLYANHKKIVNNGYRLDDPDAPPPPSQESTHGKVLRLASSLTEEKKRDNNYSPAPSHVVSSDLADSKPPVSLQFTPAPANSTKPDHRADDTAAATNTYRQ